MKHYWRQILLAGLCLVPVFAMGKGVSSAAELGPYDFWSKIEPRFNSISAISNRSDSDSKVEIRNPVINGLQTTGVINAENQMTLKGPSTWMNVDLKYNGNLAFEATFVEVLSQISFDLAAFGPPGSAQIRVAYGGISDRRRNIDGVIFRATASSGGFVIVYETDENGNQSTLVDAWSFPLSGTEASLNNFFTISTNQLYRVVIQSISNITLSNITSFHITSFKSMFARFTTATEGVEVSVSDYAYDTLLPAYPPELETVSSNGNDTSALISGGAVMANSISYEAEFHPDETIRILATIEPEIAHLGVLADVYVVADIDGGLVQVTPSGLVPFNGTVESLTPFDRLSLKLSTELDILAPFGGQLTLSASEIGKLELFVGYSIDNEVIFYNAESIIIDIVGQQ